MNNQDKNEIQANTLIDLPVTDEQARQAKGGPQPVLMVIANRDFYYKEYGA